MPTAIYVLFGAGLTVAASTAAGRLLIDALQVRLRPAETWLFSFLLGSAAWSTFLFALAAAGLVYKGVILAAAIAVIAIAVRHPWPKPELPPRWYWLAAPCFLLFFVLYLINAMAPEMSPDGTGYHLGLVSRYYRQHGFERHYENMYAHLSQGMEMLFLSAWAFGRNSAAAMVHFAFQCAMPLLVLSYGARFGITRTALAAALLVYFTPVFGLDGISAYNDVAGAAVVFGLFYLIEIWIAERTAALLIAIGTLAGFAFAIKYTLGMALIYAIVRVAWNERASRLRSLAIVSAGAALVAAPWLIKNLILTGNPVAPLFNAWFPNPFVTASFEQDYRNFMRHYDGLGSYWNLPLELTMRGRALGGFLGPFWLLAPLGLLALKTPRGRTLVFAAVVFGATYFTNVGTRFLIPMLPFAALAVALPLTRIPVLLALLVIAHGITSWPSVARRYTQENAWALDWISWKPALRLQSEDYFLRRHLQNYAAARLIEEHVPPGETVLTFNQEAESYTTREVRTWYQSTTNSMIGDLVHAPLIEAAKPTRQVEFRFEPRETTAIRVIQISTNELDQWYLNELRLYAKGRELPRTSQWRLRASANPAYIGEAFDGNPLTTWISGERFHPGMFVEVNFPRATVDRIVVVSGEIEQSSRLALEIWSKNTWVRVPGEPHIYRVPPPLGLRRMATSDLPRHGVQWLIFSAQDFGADDYFKNQQDWGIHFVGEASGRKLYRIDHEEKPHE